MNGKYGPQTAEIEAIIERLKTMTVDEAKALAAAWYDDRTAAWKAAWYAAWYAAVDAARDAAWYAILALLVSDLITPEQFDLLYGPWASVMEKEVDKESEDE